MEQFNTDRRIGFVGIIVNYPDQFCSELNDILPIYSSLIVGRQALPYRKRLLSIISLIVEGNTDEIGALTGRIGQESNITVKTGFAKPQAHIPDSIQP